MFNVCMGHRGGSHRPNAFASSDADVEALLGRTSGGRSDGAAAAAAKSPETVPVLLEIVGAIGLSFVDQNIDSFCVVRVGQLEDATDSNAAQAENGVRLGEHPNSNGTAKNSSNNPTVATATATAIKDLVTHSMLRHSSPSSTSRKLVQDKEVHRTRTINDDTNPIWTVDDKGICLLQIRAGQTARITLCRSPTKIGEIMNITTAPWNDANNVIGSLDLNYTTLVQGVGDRYETEVQHGVFLSVRFRRATREECMWLAKGISTSRLEPQKSARNVNFALPHPSYFHPNDLEFETSDTRSMFGFHHKTVKNPQTGVKETHYRVWPFPDPTRPEQTTFLSERQLHEESRRPSTQWVKAGNGTYGTVDIEILGCNNLPNMDAELVNGKTDAFCAVLFEDNILRTSVIHDTLNPRFMPWSYRAFQFGIEHPSSILFLGVFDYDEGPLDFHDPIGRIVIHLDSFDNDTMYTLTYPLFHGDTQEEQQRGTVTLRLRVSWNDISEVSKARSFVTPPRSIINTRSKKSFEIVRYLTRGSVDMKEVTVKSTKLYFAELIEYAKKFCYLLDVAAEILLWRGRLQVGKTSIWFPHHSVAVLTAMVLALEFPRLIPSILLYAIAYGLLCVNYHASSHPYPWKQIRSYRQINRMSVFGRSDTNVTIEPHTGEEESKLLDKLDMYKSTRVQCFLSEFMQNGLSVYRIYSRTVTVDVSTSMGGSGSLFSQLYMNYLAYIHMALKSNARIIRILRNFVNWKSFSTYKVTTNCLLLATAWLFFPFKPATFWLARLLVWTFFGPLMKLLDISVIRKYYRTKEQLLADGMPDTEEAMREEINARRSIWTGLLEKPAVQSMIYSGRVVSEELEKLKAFRTEIFGPFSENVPMLDTTRYPSTPLARSFAQPYRTGSKNSYDDVDENLKTWALVPGQRLNGNILPRQSVVH